MIWLLWLCFIVFDAWFNHKRISQGNKINHFLNGFYRSIVGVLFVWKFGLYKDYYSLAMFALGAFFSFWLLFNIILNYLNRDPIDYLGSRSLLDRLERKLPWIVWVIWKTMLASYFIYKFYGNY